MTDAFIDKPEDRADGWQTLVAAVLLGIAATLTALSAWQAALTDGDALQGYTKSNAALSESNFFYQQGNQVLAADQALFTQFATVSQTDPDLAGYLQTLMRPELQEALAWWSDQPEDGAQTPFEDVEGNPYVIADFAEGERFAAESAEAYDVGSTADETGDKFELATVLLALTLFFGGIATLFRRAALTHVLLGIGVLTLVAGVVQVSTAFAA